jgi:hypothetical protein
MQFVVKVSNWIGDAGWIAHVGDNGLRAVCARGQAHIFKDHDEASQALATLSPHFTAGGIRFSVEPIDADGGG